MNVLRFVILLIVCTIVSACESDEKKYERLQYELFIAEAPLKYAESAAAEGKPQCPDLTTLPTNQYMNACTFRLDSARTKVALLQRDLNRFMAGN